MSPYGVCSGPDFAGIHCIGLFTFTFFFARETKMAKGLARALVEKAAKSRPRE